MRLPQDRILHIDTELAGDEVRIVAEWHGELVRCKDCIHWQKTNIETINGEPTYDCSFCGEWADANGYCSFGERRKL